MNDNSNLPICNNTIALKGVKSWETYKIENCLGHQPCNQTKYTGKSFIQAPFS